MTTAELVTKRATLIYIREHGRGMFGEHQWIRNADHYRTRARSELALEHDGYLTRLPEGARQHFMAWYELRMNGLNPTDALIALARRTATEGPYEHGLLIAEVFGDDDAVEAADVIEVILADLDRAAEAAGEPSADVPLVPIEEMVAHFVGLGDAERAGTSITFNIDDRSFELRSIAPGMVHDGKIVGLLVEKRA